MREWIVWLLIGAGVTLFGLDNYVVESLGGGSSPIAMYFGYGLMFSGVALLLWRISRGVDL
jgi:hypothetical protein